ncbi:uncharacterized protein LOC126845486 [Adelges cooleyi]|uniref:uncharacterized protein LOC126845486 n=1 Tax=Adelges cooleyi TaxID=133065 RepID=UPI0021809B64|nr:uncharacterized protein LOC126845486 [Adelges cooleyi]
MMNHPVHGLPPREPSYYKEIAVIEYKRLCDEIWGENVNTMMMPNSQWNLAELLDGYTDKNDVVEEEEEKTSTTPVIKSDGVSIAPPPPPPCDSVDDLTVET